MYLKEIRAYGFKSFADKIVLELGKNLNGIVGPNGSGKSNIVDAVRWVLGEQSLKSLRGDSSSDIIFSGSKSRKPLNSASVTLIFDNENRHLPIDYNEVSIKRVLFRSGENEYYLNNERCRLKDIIDLLTDSGAAKESYNIISQGKIDEILSNKAIDRRVVLEEAAGVLKYKRRKEEAIRKLERTNLNLNRVNDIILELETSLNPLKEQADKANQYLEIKDELKNTEIALITNDIVKLNNEYQESKFKIESLTDEVSNLSSNLGSYDVNIIKDKEELRKINDLLGIKQNDLLELTRQHEKTDADIRLLKERIKYIDNDSIKNNLVELKEEELKITNNIKKTQNEIELLNKKLDIVGNTLTSDTEKYNSLKEEESIFKKKLDSSSKEIIDLKYKIEYLENSIINNSSLPKSVKSILDNPKFTGIHNVIGKLFEVDNKYSVAISTSLGISLTYLVVDNPNIAKELVNYLKDNNIGRATFFPLSVISPRNIDDNTLNEIRNIEGFINTADKLITYDNKYRNIMLNQLGNVIIVEDIDSANKISKLINKRYKIVSLDGQVVNVGGSITGGNQVSNNLIKEKYDLDNYQNEYRKLLEKNKEINNKLTSLNTEIVSMENNLYIDRTRKNELLDNINRLEIIISNNEQELENITNESKGITNIDNNYQETEESKLLTNLYQTKEKINSLKTEIDKIKLDKEKIENNLNELEETSKSSGNYISKKEKEINNLEIKVNRIDVKLDNLLLNLTEDYNMTFANAKEKYILEIEESEARKIVLELKTRLNNIGLVNLGAPSEYERVSVRYNFLTKQKEDLTKAEETLLEIIKEMDKTMENKFFETFNLVNKEFKIVFKDLFKGGSAELILTDPENLLETGIDIKAEPPGKKLQSLSLLSGGEKTLTAISLLFAILNVRIVPFCLFDEVEAALDDVNVESFGNYLKKYKDKTQFILITHKKKTMEYVDVLYGITMQESGVSKLVSVKLQELKK